MTFANAKDHVTQEGPARILVVEDESVVAIDLEWQLRDMGYDVCGCADNGHEAIDMAYSHHPDLVLMDIVIKGPMDGVETAEHISHALNIPVVFLTAYNDENTVRRAARTAAYGYLTKPFQVRELHAGIEVALYKARLERQLRESEQWFASTLRCVADGVVATDARGSICFMNPAAELLLGWDFDEVKGRDARAFSKLLQSEIAFPSDGAFPSERFSDDIRSAHPFRDASANTERCMKTQV